MEYRNIGGTYYVRCDRGDEIIGCILSVCEKENISSAVFTGIGGCSEAEIQTFIPEKGEFNTEHIKGMLELVSLTGNVVTSDEKNRFHHTHALFTYMDKDRHAMSGGHMKSITVLYTAEIELRPVTGDAIGRRFDPETGTGFWEFD